MKFGLFYEHQLPRPWAELSEVQLFRDSLDQIELADRLGYDYVWLAEHHHLEEYSHSTAPEVFLGACSQRTKQIRLGFGVMITNPRFSHPARSAEKVATLDVLSNGRVEFGTGESATAMELAAFGTEPDDKRALWRVGFEESVRMLSEHPYRGGSHPGLPLPARNVLPKPVQRPHPPLWMACTKLESIRLAAELGVGALTFSFLSPEESKSFSQEYYQIIKSERCVPIGETVTAEFATVGPFACSEDPQVLEACRQSNDFFNFGLMHYYLTGQHVPGETSLWAAFEKRMAKAASAPKKEWPSIGSAQQLRGYLEGLEEAGIDQFVLIQQIGRNSNEAIRDSLVAFAREVMPAFKDRDRQRVARKQAELAPFVEAALARKRAARLELEPVAPVAALGRVGDLRAEPRSARRS